MCAELKMKNLHQDETIRKLTRDLNASQSSSQPNEILRKHAESAERDWTLPSTLRRG